MRATGRRTVALLVAASLAVGLALTATSAATPGATTDERSPAGSPAASGSTTIQPRLAGLDLRRPRITIRPEQVDMVRARLDREPYRTLLAEVQQRAEVAPPPSIADQADCVQTANRDRENAKATAARNLAFLYLLDRVVDPGTGAVVTPTPADRQILGDRVRDLLLAMCTESRISVDPDRDINTSHELLQYASAYDLLVGAGYDFGAQEEAVVENLVLLTSDYYRDYTTGGAGAQFLVNNHRSKGAASIGVAALALAEYEAPPGTDPQGFRDPAAWLDFALDRTDLVVRWTYGTGDGGYGEGPHYWRFSAINLYPFLRAWDSVHGDAPWTTADGVTVPNLWRHPQFLAMQRWLLDHTLPDGTLAPIDDNKVDERMYWGAAPDAVPELGAYYGNWLAADGPYDQGPTGNTASIDLAVDEIVQYDDAVSPIGPTGSPTRFYPEGGSAVFRSGWSPDATLAIVSGEHGAARELGRTRDGLGEIWSAPHDHADPGSFLLHAYGERLLMDPGYMDYPWTLQWTMNKPSDHNMVLVGPTDEPAAQSPDDPLTASTVTAHATGWATDPTAPYPADGNAAIADTFDSTFVDTATVTARYGQPVADSARVERRFLFVDDTYLVVLDDVRSPATRTYTWPLHGNGGGTSGELPPTPALTPGQRPPLGADALPPQPYPASGGTFAQTASGGEWTRPAARLTAGLAFDSGAAPTTEVVQEYYEQRRKFLASNDTLRTSITGSDVRAAQVLYPTPTTRAAPTISRVAVADGAALVVDDPDGDRRVLVVTRRAAGTTFDGATLGFPGATTDGSLAVFDLHADGTVRSLYAEDATVVTGGAGAARVAVRQVDAGRLGVRTRGAGGHDVVSGGGAVTVDGWPVPTGDDDATALADGACAIEAPAASEVRVDPGADGRASLDDGATGIPSAAIGSGARAEVGTTVLLDALDSCDLGADRSTLTPHWEIVSAPPGSARTMTATDSLEPGLLLDAPGVYRVELVVTDGDGHASLPTTTTYLAGPPEADGEDGDLDGWFDTADRDGDGAPAATLPGSPSGVVSSSDGTGDVVLHWQPPDDGGTPLTRVRILLADGRVLWVEPATDTTVLPADALAAGPARVQARNALGWGAASTSSPLPASTTTTTSPTSTPVPTTTTTTTAPTSTTATSTTIRSSLAPATTVAEPTGTGAPVDPGSRRLPVTGAPVLAVGSLAVGLLVSGAGLRRWAQRRGRPVA